MPLVRVHVHIRALERRCSDLATINGIVSDLLQFSRMNRQLRGCLVLAKTVSIDLINFCERLLQKRERRNITFGGRRESRKPSNRQCKMTSRYNEAYLSFMLIFRLRRVDDIVNIFHRCERRKKNCLFVAGSIYRRGARRWRKLYRVNGHIFQAKRFNRVSKRIFVLSLSFPLYSGARVFLIFHFQDLLSPLVPRGGY